jgi:hypothetical protein
MNPTSVIVEGTLQPDGVTLRLEHKLSMPPGPVKVAVQSAAVRSDSTMLETLDRIHADQRKRGHEPMSENAMAAEIAETRSHDEEAEARWREIWSQTKPPSTDKS